MTIRCLTGGLGIAAAVLMLGVTSEAGAVERCGDVPRFSATNLKVKRVPCAKGRKLVKVWHYEMPINIGKFRCNPGPAASAAKYRIRCVDGRRIVRWLQEKRDASTLQEAGSPCRRRFRGTGTGNSSSLGASA